MTYGAATASSASAPSRPHELAKGLGCSVTEVEADGGKPLDALLEQVPDEFDAWVREVIGGLETAAAERERAVDEAYARLAHLAA